MSETIRTFHSAYPGSMYADGKTDESGYVRYADHAAALRERDERIVALEAEVSRPWEHSEHWHNPETGQVECECCCKWALDAHEDHKTIAALHKQVERLSAPVTDAEARVSFETWNGVYVDASTWDELDEDRKSLWKRALLAARKGAAS
jgi:hypothetical protein